MPPKVPSVRRTRDEPAAWGNDALSAFIRDAQNNQLSSFTNKQPLWAKLIKIDACFVKAATNQQQTQDMVGSLLLMRSRSVGPFLW